MPQINAKAGTGGGNLPLVMAFKQRPEGDIIQSENAYNISTTQNANGANTAKILQGASVRRLTPLEVERAQGLPDNWTRIPYKGKPADKCPDNGRYKAVGNSWAVPVAAWIARRIGDGMGGVGGSSPTRPERRCRGLGGGVGGVKRSLRRISG